MGKFYEALAELSLALEREPNKDWTLARRGIVYHQLGRHQESLHDFTRASSLDLDDPWVSERRQKLYDLFELHHGAWRAAYKDRVLMIYYEEGERQSQFAALHLNDSYFRMVYGPDSAWGTSVILLPVYWSQGTQHQGGQVDVVPHVDENDLILDIEGIVGMLHVSCQLSIQPPGKDSLTAHVRVQSSGEIVLDDRPLEAFKPAMLSSMHISETHWDAEVAYIGNPKWIITLIGERFFPRWLQPHRIPKSEWIITPSNVITSKRFGLRGGTSEWKKNAPTIIIEMNRPLQITGWVTPTENPNDDNVGLWAASKELLTSWEYKIRALRA
jgi:hypothetical protein